MRSPKPKLSDSPEIKNGLSGFPDLEAGKLNSPEIRKPPLGGFHSGLNGPPKTRPKNSRLSM